MRKTGVWVLVVVCALAVAAAAAARDPRLEKLALRKADMATARAVTLQAADLGPGWTRLPGSQSPAQEAMPGCPGVSFDFSAFTLTGQAESGFSRAGTTVASRVELYASSANAAGDFRASTRAGAERCIADAIRKQVAASGLTLELRSAKRVAAPQVADGAAAFRAVFALDANGQSLPIYFDVVVFRRGRLLGGVYFFKVLAPFRDEETVVRLVDARAARTAV